MTIKWVKSDPLVMGGEPFCYNTRLTVRQVLELRRDGYDPARLLAEHPELRAVGIANAYRFAAENRNRYADFFGRAGALLGPGFEGKEAAALPEALRLPGIVVAGKARDSDRGSRARA
jgi:uncharacterized protein (DUF433 family)